MPTVLYKLEM